MAPPRGNPRRNPDLDIIFSFGRRILSQLAAVAAPTSGGSNYYDLGLGSRFLESSSLFKDATMSPQQSATVNDFALVAERLAGLRQELYGWGRRCCRPRLNHHDAEDLVQEAIIKGIEQFETVRGLADGRLAGWLRLTMLHLALRHLRGELRSRR